MPELEISGETYARLVWCGLTRKMTPDELIKFLLDHMIEQEFEEYERSRP